MKYTQVKDPSAIELYNDDLPKGIIFPDGIAVDTETQGLNPRRDRLCMVQLSGGDGVCHLVKFSRDNYRAPYLRQILSDTRVIKIFHFARFDMAILRRYLDVDIKPAYCTKIASKLVRTYTDRHGLKDVTRELLGIELLKEQQSSDWAADELTADQLRYAASDVLNLHAIRERLNIMLARENRIDLASRCFDFLHTRVELDLMGWRETDIFAHK